MKSLFQPQRLVYEEVVHHEPFESVSDNEHEIISMAYSKIEGFTDTPNNIINAMNQSLEKQTNLLEEDTLCYEYVGDLGGAIDSIMQLIGLNMTTVAERANIQVSYLSMILNNKRIPTVKKLASIARALNDIPISYIFLKAKLMDKSKDESTMTIGEKQGMLLEPVLTSMIGRIYGIEVNVS